MSKLKDVVPHEFFTEYMEDRAAKLLEEEVVSKYDAFHRRWPGKHKNVHVWWMLESGRCVGWNENPSRGWSFPVYGKKRSSNIKVDDEVKFRGKYATKYEYSLNGVVETIDYCRGADCFGIRLENGNFKWATKEQLKERAARR